MRPRRLSTSAWAPSAEQCAATAEGAERKRQHATWYLALAEAGLGNRVEVVFFRETYNKKGFQGVIREIKKAHPGTRLHGLHGTDNGGMYVRQIYDECGWIYPWRVLRRDAVSATAIRAGAKGMTSAVVTDVLEQLSANVPVVTAGGRRFRNDNGVLTEGD